MTVPYFECGGCGRLVNLNRHDRGEVRQPCPACDRETTWTLAFDEEEGVSF